MSIAEQEQQTIGPQEGPQYRASQSSADIVIYGGSAGGGKTWLLEFEPLRHIDNPGFRGVIVRQTTTEITDEGGLWDESFELYPLVSGIPKIQKMRWEFPSGSRIRFRHLENQNLKVEWKGTQAAYIGFDQLEDMPKEAFFYLMSRNRSLCGVKPYMRATCNPQPGWLADLLAPWIDQSTGLPIPEMDGVIRWMVRNQDDEVLWYESEQEAMDAHPELVQISSQWRPKSVTFIRARLEDNKILMEKDPEYLSNLLALPKIERKRLYDGNWKISAGSQIEHSWVRKFAINGNAVSYSFGGKDYQVSALERFAVIDTAGTSKQKAKEQRTGKKISYTCSGVFDYDKGPDMLLLRDVWRDRVGWNEMLRTFPVFLDKWKVRTVLIENAHFGQALYDELKARYNCRLVGPVVKGQQTGRQQSAKLERAIASKLLSRLEFGQLLVSSDPECWPESHTTQLTSWTGLDDEVADLVDVMSYASDCKRNLQTFMVA